MVRLGKHEWKLQWWDWPLCVALGFLCLAIPRVGLLLTAAFFGFPGWVQMQNPESLNPKRHPNLRIVGLFLFALAMAFLLKQSTQPAVRVPEGGNQPASAKPKP